MDIATWKGVENGKVPVPERVPEAPKKKKLILNALTANAPTNVNQGLWRHPGHKGKNFNDIEYWVELAQVLERGKFHALFIVDIGGVYDVYKGSKDPGIKAGTQYPINDPLYLVPALTMVTKSLGFAITASTTYDVPFALARRYSTVDHISKGRVGWNIVTSFLESGAKNHGNDLQTPHDERYAIAQEFMDVCYKLWESSWREDAIKADVETNTFAEPDLVRYIDHNEKYFNVPGPHICSPSVQRTPFLYQAGMSKAGRDFAAKHAEAIFLQAPSPEYVRSSVDDIRKTAAGYGRDPQSLKFIPSMFVCTAETDEAAKAKYDEYFSYIDREGALVLFGGWFGMDLGVYDDDQDLRKVDNVAISKAISQWADSSKTPDALWNKARVAEELALGGRSDIVIGSPTTVADRMEEWIEVGDIDGFNMQSAIVPGTYIDIVDLLVPELQKRGRFWDDYAVPGGSLRENMYATPGDSHLRSHHPGSKFSWNKDDPFPLESHKKVKKNE